MFVQIFTMSGLTFNKPFKMFTQTSYAESVNDKHRLGELKALTTGGKAETDP